MATIRLTPAQLSSTLRQQAREFPHAVRRAMVGAARRGVAHMPKKTPTDNGQLRNGWRVGQVPDVRAYNDAPHAGIVEAGARPHQVSDAGMLALEQWALRHPNVLAAFQVDSGRFLTLEEAARRAAAAIAWKLRSRGQEPTYFVRNELERLKSFLTPELRRELSKLLEQPK